RDLGRREDALRWLERAERETPVADLSLELFRVRLEAGEDDLASAAAERAIARRVNASGFGRMGDSAVAAALEPIMSELIGGGRAALAREFARRVAVTFGPSPSMRLFAALAMVSDNDVPGALAELDGPMPSWRVSRDLIPLFKNVLEQLVARGHIDLALGLVTRARETGSERELLLAQLRLAARAGYPEVALAAARRLVAEVPTLNTWVVGDALVAERMPGAAWGADGTFAPLRDALGKLPNGAALGRAAIAAHERGTDAVLAAIPRTREDVVTARQLTASLASVELGSAAHQRVVEALLPLLAQAPADPTYTRLAVLAAAAVDASSGRIGERVGVVVDQLLRASPDRAKLIRSLGAQLVNAQRFASASALYERLRDSDAGDGTLARSALAAALTAGDRAAATRWIESALGRAPSAASLTLRLGLADEALAQVVGDDPASKVALEVARDLLAATAGDPSGLPAPEACEGRISCGSGRALLGARIALAEARDAAGWGRAREHLEAWVKIAPDETSARVDAAELVLVSDAKRAGSSGSAPGQALAKLLLEPLLARENPPVAALELAVELAPSRDAADVAWKRLEGRFVLAPGAARTRRIIAHLVALDAREAEARPGPLTALWKAMPVAPRRAYLLELMAGRNAHRETLGPEAASLLAAELATAAVTDPMAVRLELQRGRMVGDRRGALASAEHALTVAPWSTELTALLAESLALDDGSSSALARASQLLDGALARPPETSLTGAEERLQTPTVHPAVYESLAIVEAARGRLAEARDALGRALASNDATSPEAVYDRTARLLFAHPTLTTLAPASLAECARRASPAWSGRAAARLVGE
ncbi:MAG: hypothetical protein JNJ59_10105, partial [Deltaproteobacteria bacterium]|nr:hypothetical protein [Deltaproteobacteria bacterium]